jgi:hypothetical protein
MGYETHFAMGASAVACTVADLQTFSFPVPVDIVRFGGIVTTAFGADSWAVTLDVRPTYGSDTNRVAAPGGSMGNSLAQAVGTTISHLCEDVVEVDPGEQVVIEGTTASTAGVAIWFVEYRIRPSVAPRIANVNEL